MIMLGIVCKCKQRECEAMSCSFAVCRATRLCEPKQSQIRLRVNKKKKKQIWNENIILVRGYLYPVCTVYAYATVDGDASGFFRSLAGTDDDEVQI